MQSFVLGDEKWGYVCVGIGTLLCAWFILDYFFVHKTSYSIHRILGLSDNTYKTASIIFFILAFLATVYSYTAFFHIDILDNTIRINYLFPRFHQTLQNKEIKSYQIKTPKEEKNRILYIYFKNGKKYKSIPIGPEYRSQLYSLTDALDKIIGSPQKNSIITH